jgi:hypothetical protein
MYFYLNGAISPEMAASQGVYTLALNMEALCLLQQHKFRHEFQHVITEIRRQHEHTQYLRARAAYCGCKSRFAVMKA